MTTDEALRRYQARELSSGGAAEALGITRRAFLDLMAENGVPYLDLTPDEMDAEIKAGEAMATSAPRAPRSTP